jgi:hypothetical protein
VKYNINILHGPAQSFLVPYIAKEKSHPFHVQPLICKVFLYSKLLMFIPGINTNYRGIEFQKPPRQPLAHCSRTPGNKYLFILDQLSYIHYFFSPLQQQ